MSQSSVAVNGNVIYSATYSNVPVYEVMVHGKHVMRRRSDDWINATHILIIADYDKPARTRILEREVQKGTHEKVQGGYGKYQGTWIPLEDASMLAQKNNVYDLLRPLFEYVPGNVSPPLAPKNTGGSKPRAPRKPAAPKKQARSYRPNPEDFSDRYSVKSDRLIDEISDLDPSSPVSESWHNGNDDHMMNGSQHGRKRKRPTMANQGQDLTDHDEQQNLMYCDELMDYFILSGEDMTVRRSPPRPPPSFDVNCPIDDEGHSAIHWAAAMGDIDVVRDLVNQGADTSISNKDGRTPLMHAIRFTNNFEKRTFPKLVDIFKDTIDAADWNNATVFHHIASITQGKSKVQAARYYCDVLLHCLAQNMIITEISQVLDKADDGGDTALTIACRHGSKKILKALMGHGAHGDIMNLRGETANVLLRAHRAEWNATRVGDGSSSPIADHLSADHNRDSGIGLNDSINSNPALDSQRLSEAAIRSTQKITPQILTQIAKLASAFDVEYQAKGTDLVAAKRLLTSTQQEIQRVRSDRFSLEESNSRMRVNDANERAELARLEALASERVEAERIAELAALIKMEGQSLSQAELAPPRSVSEQELQTRLRLAAQLALEQSRAGELSASIVQAMSVASGEGKTPIYKMLVAKCLGQDEDKVDGLLEGILEELELGVDA